MDIIKTSDLTMIKTMLAIQSSCWMFIFAVINLNVPVYIYKLPVMVCVALLTALSLYSIILLVLLDFNKKKKEGE